MKPPDLDTILGAMLDTYPGISDLVFSVDRPLQVESYGELKEARIAPLSIKKLTRYHTEIIALSIIGNARHLLHDLVTSGSCDCSYAMSDRTRFRVNIFRQRGNFAIIMRKAQNEMPTLTSLGLSPIFREMARAKNGLILVTGATGSGKTTTLSAILNEINATQAVHVVTLEDPIEFLHPHKKATFNQRELGSDFDTFPNGLRSALRQAPKVIFVGEIRDRASVEIVLTAAETGHLVLSTLHTIDAGQSINRILGMFERAEESQLRLRLSETLRYIVSQRLVPKIHGGRVLINEIMGSSLGTREAIALGEAGARSFYEIIEPNATFGWTTFDQSLHRAYQAGLITEETANNYATNKAKMTRFIDDAKKQRGLATDGPSGLKLDPDAQTATYGSLRLGS
jgi:twitching motility protein PilT